MTTQTPVAKDDPLMIAWEAYKASPEFANTRKWALHDQHVDGSLWAAFCAGRESAASPVAERPLHDPEKQQPVRGESFPSRDSHPAAVPPLTAAMASNFLKPDDEYGFFEKLLPAERDALRAIADGRAVVVPSTDSKDAALREARNWLDIARDIVIGHRKPDSMKMFDPIIARIDVALRGGK